MKQQIYYIFLSLIFTGCSSNVKDKKEVEKSEQPQAVSNQIELKNLKEHSIADTIKIDLNGDRILDKAYFKTIKNKKTITVVDGITKEEMEIGLDKSFGEMGNDFSWVEFWGITEDKETYENIILNGEITGGRKIKLIHQSIYVGKNEDGGGIITFKDGKFIWIHQAD